MVSVAFLEEYKAAAIAVITAADIPAAIAATIGAEIMAVMTAITLKLILT